MAFGPTIEQIAAGVRRQLEPPVPPRPVVPSGRTRTARAINLAVLGRFAWTPFLEQLRTAADNHDKQLLRLAASGRLPPHAGQGPTKREQREFWSQVCATCGRAVPPGRPGRTCESCRPQTPAGPCCTGPCCTAGLPSVLVAEFKEAGPPCQTPTPAAPIAASR